MGLPECAVVKTTNNKRLFWRSVSKEFTPWSCCRSHKRAAVWEWGGGGGLSGRGCIFLGAGRILGRGQGTAGGHGAQGAEGEDGGIVGVPGRRTTAGHILQTQKETDGGHFAVCGTRHYWSRTGSFMLQVGSDMLFQPYNPPPSGQNLMSCGSISPLSKISPGHFPPSRKRLCWIWHRGSTFSRACRQGVRFVRRWAGKD